MKELIDDDDPEPSDRLPAGPLYVPVRPGPSGCTTRLFRTPLGGRTAVAFTSEERLTATLGAGQAWIRLAGTALRALTEPLGVTTITVDPQFMAPPVAPVRQPETAVPSRPQGAGPAAVGRQPAGPQGAGPAGQRPAVPHHLPTSRAEAPRTGTALPRPRSPQSVPARSGMTTPRSANTAPRSVNNAPQSGITAPRSANAAPRCGIPGAVGVLGLTTAVALIDALAQWAG